jgi:glutathione S-transferase
MSYSRWKDDRFWPLFRDAILRAHPEVTAESMETARQYNFKRYHFQGIGRYEPDAAYARGIASLQVLANLLPARGFLFGAKPSSIDAAIYGFTANIYFYDVDMPLKDFLVSTPNVVAHCQSIHAAVQA